NIKLIKRMELLLDPNSKECFRLWSENVYSTSDKSGIGKFARIIFQDDEGSTLPILFEHHSEYTVVDDWLCNYLLKKLGLHDIMTPTQFMICLCKIAFVNCAKLEEKLQVKTLDKMEDYPL